MYSKDYIFNLLMDGNDPDKLANDFADALNRAVQKKKDMEAKKRAEEEAKRAAEVKRVAMQKKKLNDFTTLYKSFNDFCDTYYPESFAHLFKLGITPEQVMEWFDSTDKDAKEVVEISEKTEDALSKFLKTYGLL